MPTDRGNERGLARAHIPSPLGPLVADVTDAGLRALHFDPGTWPEAPDLPEPIGANVDPAGHPVLAALATQLDAWFAGKRHRFDLPLDLRVRPFAREVLVAMVAIPYGEVRSYADLALAIGRDAGSARAVGRACNTNPVPIVVPCHRVIASDGSLGGYAGGLEVKRWLLAHEGAGPAVPRGGWRTRAGRERAPDDVPRLF